MKVKGILIALLVGVSMLTSCAEESCPVVMKADYHVKKKFKVKYKSKRKPTPSLIHITRVNYRPDRNHGY
jgi:hypothetical protein